LKEYRAGIDIGSTTVKLVLLDEENRIIYGKYRRHCAHTQKTLSELLHEAREELGDFSLRLRITGSGSINLAKAMNIEFVQEVVAVATALRETAPDTDVAIELGGEDAKIIYFKGGLEERMNGVCAGGTGSFIDQMAALLQTDAEGLNRAAESYKEIYPIAARCGVFAKTDIQPLINEGASTPDLAASIFQAVVNQTVSGLACGKPIRGRVAFLGGPLHFMPELKKAFIRTLRLSAEDVIDPENSHLFAAVGSALLAKCGDAVFIGELEKKLSEGVEITFEMPRLEPLFRDTGEYEAFILRHSSAVVPKKKLSSYSGDSFLGIDAGSMTTKLVLIGESGELLHSFYKNNNGDPIKTAISAIRELRELMPEGARIVRSASTGYGEGLLKSAFSLDEGEVETIAHCTAASFFEPSVDCVLDIGGQDMKCIRLKDGAVDSILLNEACSSGCGSFIENFANSLGHSAEEFANEALFATSPVDLGTRCTVFMNSNVKQAQKEGASVSDISAGLAYSVIKNALFKVIKLSDVEKLGKHIVVQGGTFYNKAVLRAFEKVSGREAICPDISGLMGAFGAALIARERYHGQKSTMLSLDEIIDLKYTSKSLRCGGCSNNCMLTVNRFSDKRSHITGNRCERGAGGDGNKKSSPNMVEYKKKRIFDYSSLELSDAPRGVIGIPRVLNMYENYPFWATFFKALGFRVVLSPWSDRKLYELGMDSIPSDSECYPAKLAHGHVRRLIKDGIKTIFYPCIYYEHQEIKTADNHYNCPIVIAYPENIKNNVEDISEMQVRLVRPFMAFTSEKVATDRLVKLCRDVWNIPEKETRVASHAAWCEQERARLDIRAEGKRLLSEMEKAGGKGIVLAGRPYHIDPEINHGIPELIASYGFTVFTEDSLPVDTYPERPLRVLDQWVYHSRLYAAAEFVRSRDDMELIQLNSFGCGPDAVTCDQVNDILEGSGKLYTVLKIDEVNNLGAVRIRIRSLISAMRMRGEHGIKADPKSCSYHRTEYTAQMQKAGYTILAPQMLPIHFDILESVFHKYGFNFEILKNTNRDAINTGLKYVNNDACFPSVTIVGQFMEAITSGRYDTDRLAVLMTQTGGCCRASNYVGLIRRALDKAGYSHIPVISLSVSGLEKNEGFPIKMSMVKDAIVALLYGDLIMRCLHRVRPYELVSGSANALRERLVKECAQSLTVKDKKVRYAKMCERIVKEFDELPIDEGLKKPRVGIVGEILVKYMPLANNNLVELLEREGAEAVVPDFIDFVNYTFYSAKFKHEHYGTSYMGVLGSAVAMKLIRSIRKPLVDALKKSKRFDAPISIDEIAENTKPILSLGNRYGEGWLLTGEMVELLTHGTPNIVCIQPFACLPNHVVGKGVIKKLRATYPRANIVAVDYDPGASEVNQLNRIKLMLSSAKENL
jgi:predicted CoA-substrate-specific enzyme activase